MYDSILVPTDGSEESMDALEEAIDLAKLTDATLNVLFVADTAQDSVTVVGTDVIDALEREGEEIVSEVVERARESGVDVESEVVQGDPSKAIVDYAETIGADVIVMGTHGRRGLSRMLLGSVTETVIRTSPVPVLSVRPEDTEATSDED
jgi:nucleotide-binding universal stress UspA family protein